MKACYYRRAPFASVNLDRPQPHSHLEPHLRPHHQRLMNSNSQDCHTSTVFSGFIACVRLGSVDANRRDVHETFATGPSRFTDPHPFLLQARRPREEARDLGVARAELLGLL